MDEVIETLEEKTLGFSARAKKEETVGQKRCKICTKVKSQASFASNKARACIKCTQMAGEEWKKAFPHRAHHHKAVVRHAIDWFIAKRQKELRAQYMENEAVKGNAVVKDIAKLMTIGGKGDFLMTLINGMQYKITERDKNAVSNPRAKAGIMKTLEDGTMVSLDHVLLIEKINV